MTNFNRRAFCSFVAASTAALAAPGLATGSSKPKVVVIGGGAGGATAAIYIAKDSKGAFHVTLVEPSKRYYTCFFSNLYLDSDKMPSMVSTSVISILQLHLLTSFSIRYPLYNLA